MAKAADLSADAAFEAAFSCLKPAGAADNAPILCQSQINPSLPSFDFLLVWHADKASSARMLERVDIRRAGETNFFQSIAPLDLKLSQGANNGVEVADLDFDGYFDIRIVQSEKDGVMRYRNFLWSQDDGKFIAAPALDAIVSPQLDSENQEINSEWRASDGERNADVYSYQDGAPVLIHRETDKGAGASCRRSFFDRIDDELRPNGTSACTAD